MCDDCGCGQPPEAVTYRKPGDEHHHHGDGHPHDHHHHDHGHDHDHPHDHHGHDHHHHHPQPGNGSRTLQVETDVLAQNNLLAQRNRGWFDAKKMLVLNLVSSPGSGKTTLLERTITDLGADLPVSVIEGDQQTLNDAERIAATGAPVIPPPTRAPVSPLPTSAPVSPPPTFPPAPTIPTTEPVVKSTTNEQ